MIRWWSAWGRRATLVAASIVGALVLFVLFCFETGPGHAVLERLVTPLSGGSVAISGLGGDLPNHLHARQVELRDEKGAWLLADNVDLDWHFLAILENRLDAASLRADRVIVLRRKVPSATTTPSTMTIDVARLSIARIEIDPSVLGRRSVLTASGSVHYVSRHDVAADLAVRRLDGVGRYDIHAAIAHDVIRGTITARESGSGIAGGAVGMPDLGPVSLDVRAAAQGTLNTVTFKLSAGILDAFGGGAIDLARRYADIDFSAVAPAMRPNSQLSWSSLSARGHMHGSFDMPELNANVKIGDLALSGFRVGEAQVQLSGNSGVADLKLIAAGLRIPGANPGMFAASPVVVSAQADLRKPDRPVRFSLEHPLLKIQGRANTSGRTAGNMTADLPALGAVAGAAGLKLEGTARLAVRFAQRDTGLHLAIEGAIAGQGDSALARVLGPRARLAATADVRDARNAIVNASLDGAAASAKLGGRMVNGANSFEGDLAISDLSRAVTNLIGSLKLHWRLSGPSGDVALAATGSANAATKGMAKQEIAIVARAAGLPKPKTATVHLAGSFDGSPLKLTADAANAGTNAMKITLAGTSWRSASAGGTIVVGGSQPSGSLTLNVARLADLSPLVGAPLSGSLNARADFKAAAAAIHATASNLSSGTTHIGRLEIEGSVTDPLGTPSFDIALSAPQLAISGLTGSAGAQVDGPLQNLTVKLTSAFATSGGQDFSVAADSVVNTAAGHLVVTRFDGVWRDLSVALASPATLDFRGHDMSFAAEFVSGKSTRLAVSGTVPVTAGRPMNVHAEGTADLAAMTSGLAAVGQSVRGKLALNVAVTGTTAKPQVQGTATLTGGQIDDFEHGFSLTKIEATAQAQGSTIRLTEFKAAAGPGTITGSGTIDLSAPGMPVDIGFKATKARPITSDLMTATMDSDLTLKGRLSERLTLAGDLHIRQGSINIPQKFPSQVATLDVHRAHEPPSPPPPPPSRIGLDLTVTSPGQVFVRGRGLEAEFEGELKIKGTTRNPQVLGGLTMRRGTLDLAGANLIFQSGKISFTGQSLRNHLDPTLDFVAQTEANGVTATLKITGTARQPRIELSSSPQMPQDEILAQLLFQQSAKSLSAVQLASVAQAAASLGGGNGFDPVGAIRKSLGLDRLAVGSTQGTSGSKGSTTVEAGKYVLRNVYLGARQDVSGGTRALVQVDLTKHLKAQATVTTGPRAPASTSTPLQDNGDSIGLSYEFEY